MDTNRYKAGRALLVPGPVLVSAPVLVLVEGDSALEGEPAFDGREAAGPLLTGKVDHEPGTARVAAGRVEDRHADSGVETVIVPAVPAPAPERLEASASGDWQDVADLGVQPTGGRAR